MANDWNKRKSCYYLQKTECCPSERVIRAGKTYPIKNLPTSDEFNEKKLGMQWGWNHNPDSTKWSLTKSPGHLRLMTATVTSDFTMARNTLTQRPFAKRDQTISTIATTKMDVNKMKDGDIAGLAVFQDPYAYIAVNQQKGRKFYFDGEQW